MQQQMIRSRLTAGDIKLIGRLTRRQFKTNSTANPNRLMRVVSNLARLRIVITPFAWLFRIVIALFVWLLGIVIVAFAWLLRVVSAPLLRRYGFDPPDVFERPPVLAAPPVSGGSPVPGGPPDKHKGFAKTRVEAFSDGVFAVALTLLIVDLSTTGLPHDFSDQKWDEFLPKLLAWLYGTATVGMYWVAHHNEMDHVDTVDRAMLWINLLFLCLIALFPFSSVMLGVYWNAGDWHAGDWHPGAWHAEDWHAEDWHAEDKLPPESVLVLWEPSFLPPFQWRPFEWVLQRAPVLVYGGNLVFAGLVLRWLWLYAARSDAYGRPRFLKYDSACGNEVLRTKQRNNLIPELGILLIGVGLFVPKAGQYAIIFVPVVYISLSIWYALQMERLRNPHIIVAMALVQMSLESSGTTTRDHVGPNKLAPMLRGVPGIDESVITKQLENLEKSGDYDILDKVVAKVAAENRAA
jgi:hypothetical protein